MSELVTRVVLIGIAGWVVWGMTSRRTVFVVRLSAGKATAARGRITAAFLTEVAQISRTANIPRGCIWGVVHSEGRIALRFSRAFPPDIQQQLRNWWACHGWSTKPTRCR